MLVLNSIRQTINDEPNYSDPEWKKVSPEAKDCVSSIPYDLLIFRDACKRYEETPHFEGASHPSLDH